jgi:hypothetical protein
MRNRRLPIVGVVLIALVGLVVFGTEARHPGASTFSNLPPPGMPFAPTNPGISSSWFCAGIPATPQRGGDVIVTNPTAVPIRGRLTVFSTNRKVVEEEIQVAARDSGSYALEKLAKGDYLSAFVELEGGLGLVEQRVRHPNGKALSPCSNAPSNNWYFADGLTLGAGYDLVITNPFPDYTNVTVTVLTQDGVRTPAKLQNQTVAGQSVLKVDLEQFGLRDEQLVAVEVNSTPERVVVARAQNYYGGLGRNGYSMTLGAPSADTHWYFADGEKSDNSSESLTLLNPSDQPATVTVTVFTSTAAGDDFVAAQTVDVAEGAVEKVDIDAIAGIPRGRHMLAVDSADVPVIAEQVITRGSGGGAVTVVGLGSRVTSTRWWVPSPLEDVAAASLVVANQTGEDGTFSVSALGPGGLQPVSGLQKVALPAANDFVGGFVDIDLSQTSLVGRPLFIETTVNAVVLRRPARGTKLKGRTSVLGVPEI